MNFKEEEVKAWRKLCADNILEQHTSQSKL